MLPRVANFNGTQYQCRCSFTVGSDGQWDVINEQYTRVSNEYWLLNHRPRTWQTAGEWTPVGEYQSVYHDIPVKLLRLRSTTRNSPPPWPVTAPIPIPPSPAGPSTIDAFFACAGNESQMTWEDPEADARQTAHHVAPLGPPGALDPQSSIVESF